MKEKNIFGNTPNYLCLNLQNLLNENMLKYLQLFLHLP